MKHSIVIGERTYDLEPFNPKSWDYDRWPWRCSWCWSEFDTGELACKVNKGSRKPMIREVVCELCLGFRREAWLEEANAVQE